MNDIFDLYFSQFHNTTISIMYNNAKIIINKYLHIRCEKTKNMEKVNKLRTENLPKEKNFEHFKGLYIPQDENIKETRYVIGDFGKLLGSYCEKKLCDGVNILFNKFSVKDKNEYIYRCFNKSVNGPVIVINSDKTNVESNFHQSLSNLGKGPIRQIKKCDSCNWTCDGNNLIKFNGWCPLFTCRSNEHNHNHLLCSLCQMEYYSDRNKEKRNQKKKFMGYDIISSNLDNDVSNLKKELILNKKNKKKNNT